MPNETWRRVTLDLVEPVRIAFERALFLAVATGDASSRVEAVEAIATVYAQEKQALMEEWRRRIDRLPDEAQREALFRLDVLERDGWRCVATRARLGWPCDTSRRLTVHHAVTRGEIRKSGDLHLLTDPSIGVTLCNSCHARVQEYWQVHAPALLAYIASYDNARRA